MTAVRPPIFPPVQTPLGGARPDAGRSAAQKAFFDMALGKAAAPAAAVASPPSSGQTAAPVAARATPQRLPDPAAEKPQKILRPGSLLDIRV